EPASAALAQSETSFAEIMTDDQPTTPQATSSRPREGTGTLLGVPPPPPSPVTLEISAELPPLEGGGTAPEMLLNAEEEMDFSLPQLGVGSDSDPALPTQPFIRPGGGQEIPNSTVMGVGGPQPDSPSVLVANAKAALERGDV